MGNVAWQNFITKYNNNGVSVDALFGDPLWILGEGSPGLEEELDWIVQYQESAPVAARFKGLHMDVEVSDSRISFFGVWGNES